MRDMSVSGDDIGACATDDKLDLLLDKIKSYKNNLDTNFAEMKNTLNDIDASYNEQLQDGLTILKQIADNNEERNAAKQKQLDQVKKGTRDARQLAGAYRMSKGGAPWMVSNCQISTFFNCLICFVGHQSSIAGLLEVIILFIQSFIYSISSIFWTGTVLLVSIP